MDGYRKCDSMSGPWGYYGKWNRWEGKRQIPHSYVESKTTKQTYKKDQTYTENIDGWLPEGKGEWGWAEGVKGVNRLVMTSN